MANINFDITGNNASLLASLQQAQQAISKTIGVVESTGAKVDASFVNAGKSAQNMASQVDKIGQNGALDKAQKSADEMGKSINKASNSVTEMGAKTEATTSGMESSFSKVGKAIGAYFAVGQIKDFIGEVSNVRKEFQSLEVSFSTLLGSDKAGKKMFSEITQFATSTPMLEKDLAKAAQTMLGFNISAESVMTYLKELGDISMGDSEKFQSLTLAFSQIQSTGKLMGQDLLQLINAGFNPLAEISRTTGKSMATLKDEMSKGQISAQMVADAFQSATSEGGKFNGMLATQANTMAGAYSNLEGAMQKFENAVGEKLEPVLVNLYKQGYKTFNDLAAALEDIPFEEIADAAQQLMRVVLQISAAYGTYKAVVAATAVVENLRYQATLAQMAGMTKLSALTTILKEKTIALNKVIMENPYALMAAAIAGLLVAMYQLGSDIAAHDAKIAAYREQMNKTAHAGDELKKSLESLRKDAIKKQGEEVADVESKYRSMQAQWNALGNDLNAKKKFVTNNKDAFHSLGFEVNSVEDAEMLLVKNTDAVVAAMEARAKATAYQEMMVDAYKKKIQAQQNVKNNTSGYRNAYQGGKTINWNSLGQEEKDYLTKQMKSGKIKDTMQKGGMNEFGVQQWVLTNEAANALNTYNNNKVLRRRQQGLKSIEDASDKQIKALEQEAKAATDDAEKKMKAVGVAQYQGGGTSSATTSKKTSGKTAAQLAADRKKAAQELLDLMEKQATDRENLQKSLDERLSALQVGNEKESAQKRLEQLKLSNAKEMAELKKEEKDAIQAEKDRQKAVFDAQEEVNAKTAAQRGKKYAKRTFTDANVDNTQIKAIQDQYKSLEDETTTKQSKAYRDLYEEEAQRLRDYLKEYGTIQEQKLAITREYDAKIEATNDSTEKMRLEKQKQASLQSVNAQSLANGIDWSSVMTGVGGMVKSIAQDTLTKIDDYMKTDEFKKLSATDKKTYTDLRANVAQSAGANSTSAFNFGIWDDIARYTKSYQDSLKKVQEANQAHEKAVNRLKKVEDDYANATDQITKIQLQSDLMAAKKEVAITAQNQNEAQSENDTDRDNLSDASEKATNGLNNFASYLNEINGGSLYGFANGMSKLITSLSKGSEGIGKGLSELGGKIGGIVGAILQIIDALGDDPVEFIEGLFKKISNAVETILSNLPELIKSIAQGIFDVIGSVVKGVANVFSFGAGDSDPEYKEDMKDLTASNNALKTAVENLKTTIEDANTADAISNYKLMMNAVKEEMANTQEQLSRSGNASSNGVLGIGGSHSSNYEIDKQMSAADWKRVSKYAGVAVNSASDFWNLTSEQMWKVATYADDLYGKIEEYADDGKENAAQYMDDYIAYWQELRGYEEDYYEYLTGISFDSMKDDFANSLMDMDSSVSDFANSMEEKLTEAILNAALNAKGGINDGLQELYDELGAKMEDANGDMSKVDETWLNDWIDRYKDKVAEGITLRDTIAEKTGYDDVSSSEASGSINAAKSMTEDTANELIGRMTAIQLCVEATRATDLTTAQQIMSGVTMLTTIAANAGESTEVLNSILLQHVESNGYLNDMVRFNRAMYEEWGSKITNMADKINTL